jgi:hypothetical protein
MTRIVIRAKTPRMGTPGVSSAHMNIPSGKEESYTHLRQIGTEIATFLKPP